MFLFHKIFVLPSLRICLFFHSHFVIYRFSVLCIATSVYVSLSRTHIPDHAHMSTHAFTDKTFSWRVNTREKRKMTCSNHTEALPVITLCCHWWKRNQRTGSSLPRLHRCLQQRSTRVNLTQDTVKDVYTDRHCFL